MKCFVFLKAFLAWFFSAFE